MLLRKGDLEEGFESFDATLKRIMVDCQGESVLIFGSQGEHSKGKKIHTQMGVGIPQTFHADFKSLLPSLPLVILQVVHENQCQPVVPGSPFTSPETFLIQQSPEDFDLPFVLVEPREDVSAFVDHPG